MRKLFCLLSILILIFATTPVYGSNADPYTELNFGTSEAVRGIDAVYTMQTDDVKSVSFEFAEELNMAQGNFINGKVRIAIASTNTIDLSKPLCKVTATLNDDTKVAPKLELSELYFNGKSASENLIVLSQTATLSNEKITVDIDAYNDYLDNDYLVFAAAYNADGQMLIEDYKALNFTTQKSASLSFELENARDATEVKIFYLTKSYVPLFGLTELSVN